MAIWNALTSVGGNLLGGFLQNNYLSDAQQAQMDFAAAEAQKNRDFQLEMWNKTNEYNTAAKQRSRLEDAGLNPYLMLDGGSAGVASSPSGAQASSPGIPSYQNPLVGASDALLKYQDLEKTRAETKGIEIDNQTRAIENMERIKNLTSDTENKQEDTNKKRAEKEKTWFERGLLEIENYVNSGTADSRIESGVARAAIDTEMVSQTRQVTAGIILDNATKDINLSFLPQEIQARIKNIWASTAHQLAGASLANSQANYTRWEDWWYHNPNGVRAHEINNTFWNTQNIKNQILRLPANARKVAEIGLQREQLLNDKIQSEIDKNNHSIFQGYWDRVNNSINTIANLRR